MVERRRPGTRVDHQSFCVTEGWIERRRAAGKRGTHHVNYELAVPDGRILYTRISHPVDRTDYGPSIWGHILYTRISHPVDRTDYGPSIWGHILKDQLEVTAEEFRACVEDRTLPSRSQMPEPREAIPLGVLRVLTQEAHIPEAEVRAMTKADAIQRLADFYTHGS